MIQIDMQMPTKCIDCPACNEYLMCAIPVNGRKLGENDVRDYFTNGRPEWCPLKEQEAVEPFHKCIGKNFSLVEDSHYDYCPYCGKPITWAKQEGR